MKGTRAFPALPESVHAARRFATGTLDGTPRATLEAVELMVSELATNCIRHERATFHVAILWSDGRVRIEVTDAGEGRPRLRSPAPTEPSGRGLRIVDMLADRWGVAPESPAGKTVWFELDVASTPGATAERGGSLGAARALDRHGATGGRRSINRPGHRRWRSINRPGHGGVAGRVRSRIGPATTIRGA